MKIIGNFNNVSKELKPKPLKRGETVLYRLLTGKPDPSRLDETGKPTIQYGKSVRIPTKDRIWDPFKNDGQGEFVDIGVVQDFNNNQVTRTRPYYATNGGDYQNHGIITLSGNSNDDAELYEFFEISNINKSFEHRDPSVEPIIERLDIEKENSKKINTITEKADALIKATSMNLSEMRDFAAQMNWNEIATPDEIKSKVLHFAEQNPSKFLDLLDDTQASTRSLVKQAITKGIIQYDVSQHRIIWAKTEQTLATLDRIDGKNHVEIFADWLLHAKNGSSVKTKLEQQVRGSRKETAKEGVE